MRRRDLLRGSALTLASSAVAGCGTILDSPDPEPDSYEQKWGSVDYNGTKDIYFDPETNYVTKFRVYSNDTIVSDEAVAEHSFLAFLISHSDVDDDELVGSASWTVDEAETIREATPDMAARILDIYRSGDSIVEQFEEAFFMNELSSNIDLSEDEWNILTDGGLSRWNVLQHVQNIVAYARDQHSELDSLMSGIDAVEDSLDDIWGLVLERSDGSQPKYRSVSRNALETDVYDEVYTLTSGDVDYHQHKDRMLELFWSRMSGVDFDPGFHRSTLNLDQYLDELRQAVDSISGIDELPYQFRAALSIAVELLLNARTVWHRFYNNVSYTWITFLQGKTLPSVEDAKGVVTTEPT